MAACQADARVVAAFLGGSYARGQADAFSDIDLGLITSDAAYDDFLAGREAFLRRLGKAVFLEDFGLPDTVFFVYDSGAEGELCIGRAGRFLHLHSGPYRALVDKHDVLTGVTFAGQPIEPAAQVDLLRKQLTGFWHEVSHFVTAMQRGQRWWAFGQLAAMRRITACLLRLDHDFAAQAGAEEVYFKIESALPPEQLARLQPTLGALEADAMLQAALSILALYTDLASPLAARHGLAYPAELEGLTLARLAELRTTMAQQEASAYEQRPARSV